MAGVARLYGLSQNNTQSTTVPQLSACKMGITIISVALQSVVEQTVMPVSCLAWCQAHAHRIMNVTC